MVRINLSDQTDISDLFGSDLSVEGGAPGQFSWVSGPFLAAMERGDWILLDKLNLASQSVLKGLNAMFDHRGEVYVPVLDRVFPLHPATKIFGCQNPLTEGGDRKGLPRSFLNRFSKVFMAALSPGDLGLICSSLYPTVGLELVDKMVSFNCRLEREVVARREWGQQGAPWEFNLRDLLRWCKALVGGGALQPGRYVGLVYGARLRRREDRLTALAEVYLDLGEVSVENQDYGRAKSITGPDKRQTFPGKALVCGCSEVNLLSCLNRFVRLLDC